MLYYTSEKERRMELKWRKSEVLLEAKCVTTLFWFSERKLRFWSFRNECLTIMELILEKPLSSLNLFLKLIWFCSTREPLKSFMDLSTMNCSEGGKYCFHYFRDQILKNNSSGLAGELWQSQIKPVFPNPKVTRKMEKLKCSYWITESQNTLSLKEPTKIIEFSSEVNGPPESILFQGHSGSGYTLISNRKGFGWDILWCESPGGTTAQCSRCRAHR